ncbi:hypothetical protein SBRY_50337 [Actinacidiphila bryophytorum]|uniref:Uncharacterized protein n=1 Tax=Actinacidiphila bryophytorum TaxID=1436133 RepID=A0A9W4MJ85_9ACTN|nr:hypothetical protein SBRY_50337 [Actinacidiphila bryophytorum]
MSIIHAGTARAAGRQLRPELRPRTSKGTLRALGVRPERINTIRDWQAAAKVGARTYGEGSAACAESWRCRSPAPTPPEGVRDAFRELERGHHGKIGLRR